MGIASETNSKRRTEDPVEHEYRLLLAIVKRDIERTVIEDTITNQHVADCLRFFAERQRVVAFDAKPLIEAATLRTGRKVLVSDRSKC